MSEEIINWRLIARTEFCDDDEDMLVKFEDDTVCTACFTGGVWWATFRGRRFVRLADTPRFWQRPWPAGLVIDDNKERIDD